MMNELFQKVLERNTGLKGLNAHNFPHGPVTVTLRDGSCFVLYDAFALHDKKEEAYLVYSEHYGNHFFDDDLIIWCSGPTKPEKRARKVKVA